MKNSKRMRLSVKTKLLGSMGVMVLLLIAMGAMTYIMVGGVANANKQALETMDEAVFTVEKQADHLAWVNELGDMFLLGTAFTGALDHRECDFGKWYYEAISADDFTLTPEEYQQLMLSLEEPHRQLHQSAQEIVDICEKPGAGEEQRQLALGIYKSKTQQRINDLRTKLGNLREYLDYGRDTLYQASVKQGSFSQQVAIIISLFSLVAGLAIALLLNKSFTNPVVLVYKAMQKAEQGDLTTSVTVKNRDELGQLANSFNSMVKNIGELVKKITMLSGQTHSASQELAAASEEITIAADDIAGSAQDVSSNAEKQRDVVNHTSAVVQEISAGIENIATNANAVNVLSDKTVEATKSGQDAIKQAENQMRSIGSGNNEVQGAITKVTDSSNRINRIIDVINDIAEQTNLLALNAAIEAARAGESGRGFAVVAEEVRKLAEESLDATKEITQLIMENEKNIQDANSAMAEGTKYIEEGMVVVNGAGEKFADIVAFVTDVSNQIQNISASIQEMSSGSQEIVGAMNEINATSSEVSDQVHSISAATEEQSASMQEAASSSQNLAKIAEDLTAAVSQFKV